MEEPEAVVMVGKDPPSSSDDDDSRHGEAEVREIHKPDVVDEEDVKPKATEPESPSMKAPPAPAANTNATAEEEDMKTNAGAAEKESLAMPEEDDGELDDDYYNSTSSALSEDRWEEMFQRLLDFKEMHGHCLVPNRYKEDLQLGAWVSAQRKNYKILESNSGKATPMTMERAQQLVKVGFEWTAKNPRHLMWEVRFAELKDFKNNYGHAQVPIGWEQNVQLANWVSTQRQEYKNLIKGKTSRLNDKRVELLNSLGFAWELQRGGRRRRLTVTNKGNHPGANGTPPGHPAGMDSEGPDAKKARLDISDDRFAIDDGTSPVRRSSTGRKRTTLKKKVTSVDESAKCILPGVAIMGGEGGRGAATPRSASKRAGLANNNDHSRTSPNISGNEGGPNPYQQAQMQQHAMQMQQQGQMQPQQAYSNDFLRMVAANGGNPWQMLPNGAYQQMGMAHQMMGGGFFPMATGPFGMNPYGQRGMDPPQYPGDGTDGGQQNGNMMSPQEMEYRRMQQQQAYGQGGNGPNQDAQNQQPNFVPSFGGGPGEEQDGMGQNRQQQMMQGQGPGGMMQQQFGGGWNGMQMGQQGPFWNMNNMNMNDPAAAAAAAAQHLQAAAALTAGMDERSLPPALAPLASAARQMNGMMAQQGMNGVGGGQGGGNSQGNQGGPQNNGNGGGSHNMMNQNNAPMPNNNMPNMASHVRGRRGDPPADPPSAAPLSMMMNDSPMKQGVFEDADE